jgi:predicted Holliday junction resolvase-like endonuclease
MDCLDARSKSSITGGAATMILELIALVLAACLVGSIVKLRQVSKDLATARDRYEKALWEAKSRTMFADEAFEAVEDWKKRYESERTSKEQLMKETEACRKSYREQVHSVSDTYRAETGKEEESWGDREPY